MSKLNPIFNSTRTYWTHTYATYARIPKLNLVSHDIRNTADINRLEIMDKKLDALRENQHRILRDISRLASKIDSIKS